MSYLMSSRTIGLNTREKISEYQAGQRRMNLALVEHKYKGTQEWSLVQTKVAKKYAQVAGYVGVGGGWIYKLRADGSTNSRPTCQGWVQFYEMRRDSIRDWLTQECTAGSSFAELVNSNPSYRPTIRLTASSILHFTLAQEYDAHMAKVGDTRRAHRVTW